MILSKARRLLREAEHWAAKRAQRSALALALLVFGLAAAGLVVVVAWTRPAQRAGAGASLGSTKDLRYEVRAVDAVWPLMERQGFSLRFVDCRERSGRRACSVCSTGPRHILGAALVVCDEASCSWPLDGDMQAQIAFEEDANWVPDDCIDREDEE